MNDQPIMLDLLAIVASGRSLDRNQARGAFELIMTGKATDAQIGALLAALQVRPAGPSVDEITGAAQAMRAHASNVTVPAGMSVIDTCGTGGDHKGTFNISTAAAIVAAGAGAKIAKHGNRSVTSKSGSSQVLEALGVRLDVAGPTLTRCLNEAGICFCFAPAHHPAMKFAAGPRKELGFRTIFNLLGPLTNPAGATRQVLGVFSDKLVEPIARVLAGLGAEKAMVVHGNGLDEITLDGPTTVAHIESGRITISQITSAEAGLAPASLDTLRVQSVEQSAQVIRDILDGQPGPARDIVVFNAAAALLVADLADDLRDAVAQAQRAIDTGRARTALATLAALTHP